MTNSCKIKQLEETAKKAEWQQVICEYNNILNCVYITKLHLDKEIDIILNKEKVKKECANKLKNTFQVCLYILQNYKIITFSEVENFEKQYKKIKEVKYLYNEGKYRTEMELNIFKYNKWQESPAGICAKNKLFTYQTGITLSCFLAPVFLPTIISIFMEVFNHTSMGIAYYLLGWFAVSAFASPILLPLEIIFAHYFKKGLKSKYLYRIEEYFNIKTSNSVTTADIATGALALKTHLSLKNAWKKGDWIEK